MLRKLFGKGEKQGAQKAPVKEIPQASDEKVACVQCGKMILKRMAVRNGGKCFSCTTTSVCDASRYDLNSTYDTNTPATGDEPSGGKQNSDIGNKTFSGAETITLPDPWGVGGTGPFILKREADIEAILSAPDPEPPKPVDEWNKYYEHPAGETRGYLAMAYMQHPSPKVREATIRFVSDRARKDLRVGLVLAQRLAVDPESQIRKAAGEAIWKRGSEELVETMNYLAGNDEHPGNDGNGEFISQAQVRQALQTLHDDPGANMEEFQSALLYAWCWQNEELAGLGRRLVDQWISKRTYTREHVKELTREIGIKVNSIGGFEAMKMMFRPITLLVGSDAATDLNFAWSGIGGWLP